MVELSSAGLFAACGLEKRGIIPPVLALSAASAVAQGGRSGIVSVVGPADPVFPVLVDI